VARLLPSSLTGRLVVTAVALVALVSVLLAVATTAVLRSYLNDQLDGELTAAAGRAVGAYRGGPAFPPHDEDDGRPEGPGEHEGPEIESAFGQASGTVTAYLTDLGPSGEVITSDGERESLDDAVLTALGEVPVDGEPHTVTLPGLGNYRVLAVDAGRTELVTGLPTNDAEDTVASMLGLEVLLTSLGVALAGGVAFVLVRRQMRPLRQVARTAHDVAAIPLATGEVGVTARVPAELTDERTEVGQVGAALNTLLGHVEHALDERHRSEQQVRQFVADASHELRTPLATISGYAELSRRTAPPDPEQLSHAMGKVEVEAARMSSLVEDLLLLARLDAGRPLGRDDVDLTRLVLESVDDARVTAPGHRWVLDLPQEPVVVPGDAQRLHQVVSNLLSNARRHTPSGTTVRVGVRVPDSGRAVVTVTDDGPGIPADLQHQVFDRFTRGDSARTRESGGAGLGLSLARAIVEAHGGHIAVASRPGETRFSVTLPAVG
jgi:two-component system OmpR family sensor kinase